MEEFDRGGVWWLPANGRSQAVGGQLKFDDSRGLRLSRVGLQLEPRFDATYDVILGQTTDGRLWTLEDCGWSQPSVGRTGGHQVIREWCRPAAAYSFTHLPSRDDRLFMEAGCAFSGMAKWLGDELFKFDAKGRPDGLGEYVVRYSPPASVSITLPTVTVAIEHLAGFPSLGRTFGALRGIGRFRFATPTSLSLSDWIWRFFSPLQNLLTLAIGRPNAIVGAWVLAPIPGSSRRAESEVFFRPPYGKFSMQSRSGGDDSLFGYQSVQDRWADICGRWLKLYTEPKMVRVLDSYFSGWYRRVFRASDFQNLVQAAEQYHRLRRSGSYPGLADSQARRAAILAQLSAEDRAWLASRLRAKTEPNLETRLADLLDEHDAIMRLIAPDRKAFINAVASRRHELSHQGPSRAEEHGPFDLFQLARRLEFLLQACLLRDLGFSEAETTEAVRSTSAFCYVESRGSVTS